MENNNNDSNVPTLCPATLLAPTMIAPSVYDVKIPPQSSVAGLWELLSLGIVEVDGEQYLGKVQDLSVESASQTIPAR